MAITSEAEAGVLRLTILGEGAGNAITWADARALSAHLRAFDEDHASRAAILCGGAAHFSSGLAPGALEAALLARDALAGALTPYRPRKPVVAAFHGDCRGEALIIALQASDLRIADESARFSFPDLRAGFAGASVRARLARQIPYVHAMRLALTGVEIGADEALRIGLITEAVPRGAALARAEDLARAAAALSPFALWGEKETILNGEQLSMSDNNYAAIIVDMVSHFSPDIHEGVEAFVQKRAPSFWTFD